MAPEREALGAPSAGVRASTAQIPSSTQQRRDGWDDEEGDEYARRPVKALTREEAQVLRTKEPPLSPWRVVAVQVVVGVLVAVLVGAVTGQGSTAWSALYGAATVVVPGALMARGMTSRLSSVSPGASAVSFMLWEMVKIAVSIAMLVVAPKLVPQLSWPALLLGLVVGMKVYWVALLWRGSTKKRKQV